MNVGVNELPEAEPKNLLEQYKIPLVLLVGGLFFVLVGIRLLTFKSESPVEFVEGTTVINSAPMEINVDVAGAVVKPGLYTLPGDSRIQDALLMAGGLSPNADRSWVAKQLNLAARLADGTKIYIPTEGELGAKGEVEVLAGVAGISASLSKDIININTASVAELDTLPGIGQVSAEKIVGERPYQNIDELLSKKVVNKGTFEKIKARITTN